MFTELGATDFVRSQTVVGCLGMLPIFLTRWGRMFIELGGTDFANRPFDWFFLWVVMHVTYAT